MKFYISQETKQELEAKVAQLEKYNHLIDDIENCSDEDCFYIGERGGEILALKKILESSIVLPVEESFEVNNTIISEKKWMFDKYPNGVIINKQ
jgi:hypothetical protein